MKTIHLNENAREELKRFICAHELGHAIFHAKVNMPFLSVYTLYSFEKIEGLQICLQLNYFYTIGI